MKIQHEKNDKKGRFYVEIDGVEKAEMTYSFAGADKIIIDHTHVDDSLRGEHVGYNLVAEAVGYARENNIKIMPLCPFASAVFKKKANDYKDVRF